MEGRETHRGAQQSRSPTMPDAGPQGSDAAEVERAQRLRVLHDLAQEARPLERPSATSLAPQEPEAELARRGLALSADRRAMWARAQRQQLLRVGIFVLLVALVPGTIFALQGGNPLARFATPSRPTAAVAATPLAINPSTGGVDCLYDATWSPQGTSLAVIGAGRCFQGPNMLTVFDATAGKVQAQVNLDAVADPVAAQTLGVQSNRVSVQFQQVLWSLTGRIAVLFVGFAANQQGSAKTAEGLVLTDANGSQTQAAALPLPSIDPHTYEVWDLTSNHGTIEPDSIAHDDANGGYSYATVAPALQYTWDFSSSLAVKQGFPNPSDPSAAATQLAVPVGSPTTGPFSIWQRGYLALTQEDTSTFPTWFTTYGAWSPDGSRIVDSIYLNAVLQPLEQPAIDASALKGTNFANAPLLLVRDAGMQAVLKDLHANVDSTGAAQIAWRPDGKVLAAQAVPSTGGPVRHHEVTLYDCTKGTVLVTLAAPPSRGAAQLSGGALLRWSPDGTHLMLYDPALHVLAVWGPGMLPK